MKKGTSYTTLETQIPDREEHSYWFYSLDNIWDTAWGSRDFRSRAKLSLEVDVNRFFNID